MVVVRSALPLPERDGMAAHKGPKKFQVQFYPYTHCREQHHWRLYDGTVDNTAQVGYKISQCANCGMKRYQTISLRTGQYVRTTRYAAPKDYYIQGGLDRLARGEIRVFNFLTDLQARQPKQLKPKPKQ